MSKIKYPPVCGLTDEERYDIRAIRDQLSRAEDKVNEYVADYNEKLEEAREAVKAIAARMEADYEAEPNKQTLASAQALDEWIGITFVDYEDFHADDYDRIGSLPDNVVLLPDPEAPTTHYVTQIETVEQHHRNTPPAVLRRQAKAFMRQRQNWI